MDQFLTLHEVAQTLKLSPQTIYNNGPAQYGGIKIGGAWRFPLSKVGSPPESKPKEINTGYSRRFGKKGR